MLWWSQSWNRELSGFGRFHDDDVVVRFMAIDILESAYVA